MKIYNSPDEYKVWEQRIESINACIKNPDLLQICILMNEKFYPILDFGPNKINFLEMDKAIAQHILDEKHVSNEYFKEFSVLIDFEIDNSIINYLVVDRIFGLWTTVGVGFNTNEANGFNYSYILDPAFNPLIRTLFKPPFRVPHFFKNQNTYYFNNRFWLENTPTANYSGSGNEALHKIEEGIKEFSSNKLQEKNGIKFCKML
jgi:hypothetical protein